MIPGFTVFVAMTSASVRAAVPRILWIGLGGAVPVALYLAVNFATIGGLSPSTDPAYLKSVVFGRGGVAPDDFAKLTHVGALVLVWPLVLGVVHVRHRILRAIHTFAVLGVMNAWIVGCTIYTYLAHEASPGRMLGHLLVATPVLAFGLALGRTPRGATEREKLASAIWALALTGSAGILILNPVAAGLRLGDRYLLPMIPFWVLASVAVVRRQRVLLIAAVPALALGIWSLVLNHKLMEHTRSTNALTVAAVRQHDDRFVTAALFWGPQVIAETWQDKGILQTDNVSPAILDAIRATGATGVIEMNGGLSNRRTLVREPDDNPLSKRVRRYVFVPR